MFLPFLYQSEQRKSRAHADGNTGEWLIKNKIYRELVIETTRYCDILKS